MLPVARLLGHKEWTKRKSDPRHSMNWRRDRVANFTPRAGGAAPAPSSTGDSDMRLVKVKGTAGPIFLVTDFDVTATNDIHLVESEARASGVSVVDLHQEQIDKLIESRRIRQERLGRAPAPASGPPMSLDEDSLAAALARPHVAAAIGEALAAAQDRRARDGDPATGPVS